MRKDTELPQLGRDFEEERGGCVASIFIQAYSLRSDYDFMDLPPVLVFNFVGQNVGANVGGIKNPDCRVWFIPLHTVECKVFAVNDDGNLWLGRIIQLPTRSNYLRVVIPQRAEDID
jgi:hypothetical protein